MQQPTPQQDLNWILVIERDRERRTERGRKRDGERDGGRQREFKENAGEIDLDELEQISAHWL